ncbi:MAG: OmpW family protein [Burkholderiaceae bacterium]|nr:OmpW family protein [Burkholderiaceae bacterium]
MKVLRIHRLAAVAVALAGMPLLAQAQAVKAGDLLVRGRVVYLDTANKDDIAGLDIGVSNKTIPEVDITYFFSPSLAAELVLTYPQKHDVSANGSNIGSLKHLPPTLSVQYHFGNFGAIKPYVGVGLNYTRFSSVNLPAGLSIEKDSFGLSVGGGVDYAIDSKWSVNADIKKVQIRTDLSSGGTNLGTIKVDPWLIGVGVGYKF